MRKIGAEIILIGIASTISLFVWIVSSIYSISAKADQAEKTAQRAIVIEEKVDYIYKYLIEQKKEIPNGH